MKQGTGMQGASGQAVWQGIGAAERHEGVEHGSCN
jgi:hypothetical protein